MRTVVQLIVQMASVGAVTALGALLPQLIGIDQRWSKRKQLLVRFVGGTVALIFVLAMLIKFGEKPVDFVYNQVKRLCPVLLELTEDLEGCKPPAQSDTGKVADLGSLVSLILSPGQLRQEQFYNAIKEKDEPLLSAMQKEGLRIKSADLCDFVHRIAWGEDMPKPAIEIIVASTTPATKCSTFNVLRDGIESAPADRVFLNDLIRPTSAPSIAERLARSTIAGIDAYIKLHGQSEEFAKGIREYLGLFDRATKAGKSEFVAACKVAAGHLGSSPKTDEYFRAMQLLSLTRGFFDATMGVGLLNDVRNLESRAPYLDKRAQAQARELGCSSRFGPDKIVNVSQLRAALAKWAK